MQARKDVFRVSRMVAGVLSGGVPVHAAILLPGRCRNRLLWDAEQCTLIPVDPHWPKCIQVLFLKSVCHVLCILGMQSC